VAFSQLYNAIIHLFTHAHPTGDSFGLSARGAISRHCGNLGKKNCALCESTELELIQPHMAQKPVLRGEVVSPVLVWRTITRNFDFEVKLTE